MEEYIKSLRLQLNIAVIILVMFLMHEPFLCSCLSYFFLYVLFTECNIMTSIYTLDKNKVQTCSGA